MLSLRRQPKHDGCANVAQLGLAIACVDVLLVMERATERLRGRGEGRE